MGRLQKHFDRAKNAIGGVEDHAERVVDEIVTRTEEVRTALDRVKTEKLIGLDGHMNDVAEFAKDVEDFGKNDRSGDGANAYAGTSPPKV